jgi:hypothetical protein
MAFSGLRLVASGKHVGRFAAALTRISRIGDSQGAEGKLDRRLRTFPSVYPEGK